jgi:hypothetical protein
MRSTRLGGGRLAQEGKWVHPPSRDRLAMGGALVPAI